MLLIAGETPEGQIGVRTNSQKYSLLDSGFHIVSVYIVSVY
jgi:hypothetical protein